MRFNIWVIRTSRGSRPNAFDCSGLTMAAYRTIGIHLPHHSALQVRYGHRVDWHTEPIQPGDLIFMHGSIRVQDYGHTGIAINATEWINAAHSGPPCAAVGSPSRASSFASV